jgi:CheY-like chemotaxis protein
MRAFACRTGAEGVSAARELMPDLILLDHAMPDATGEVICRALRSDEATAMIPIIAVTRAPETFHAEPTLVDAVLTKPCQRETLMSAALLFVHHLTPMIGWSY